MPQKKQRNDIFITSVIKICGYSSILFVGLILIFLLKEGLPALKDIPLRSLFNIRWYPIESFWYSPIDLWNLDRDHICYSDCSSFWCWYGDFYF
jgi:ABC-type phosphate transport system permease subunit